MSRAAPLLRWAGRLPLGTAPPVVVARSGLRQTHRAPDGAEATVYGLGGACGEVLSGPRLAEVLAPAHEKERRALQALRAGQPAAPLSLHTSFGVTEELGELVAALEPHVPFEDWCVSFQLEGASAVHAAVDMLFQLRTDGRRKVAVASNSYHGPGSTSLGSRTPLFDKPYQVVYPAPALVNARPGEGDAEFEGRIREEQRAFLDRHGAEIAVLLVEPQWGSSAAAQPWPKELLREFVAEAQARGILVVADEVMCGLGRHGHGSFFLSAAWGLPVDALTFGKAIAGGTNQLSGAIVRHREAFEGRTVMQSHTYSGASARALTTAAAVCRVLPELYPHISRMHGVMAEHFAAFPCRTTGQGLLWGARVEPADVPRLKQACAARGVAPYWTPTGLLASPPLDVDETELREGLGRLAAAFSDIA